MATHKSSKKRARQAIKRRERNRQYMSKVRTAIKKFKVALTTGEGADSIKELLIAAQSNLAKAAKKGIVHRNNAQRHISRLALSLNKLGANAGAAVTKTAAPKKAAKKPAAPKKATVSPKKQSAPAKKKASTKRSK